MITRAKLRTRSNNLTNPNKNLCVLACAQQLGVANESRYFHWMKDLVRAARTKYTVRSRMSSVKGLSVAKARAKMASMATEVGAIGYMIEVSGHALLVRANGKPWVDTDPRKVDRRKILKIYVVYPK